MSTRGHSAIITYERDHLNKSQRHTPSSCRKCCQKKQYVKYWESDRLIDALDPVSIPLDESDTDSDDIPDE